MAEVTEEERQINRVVDGLLMKVESALAEVGAEPELIVDRLMTRGVCHIVSWHGSAEAAAILHRLADNVAAGAFARLDPSAFRNVE
jgi:hypothetical protein